MTPNERRARLQTLANPDGRLDYVSGLAGAVERFVHGKAARISVRYVPDRRILVPAAFGEYLAALAPVEWDSLEQLATTILDDFTDQLVPRWTRVVVTLPEGAHKGVGAHRVMVEDRQPGWDNVALLSRI